MEFFDVLKARHSIRAYDSRPVEPDKLQQILEAVNGAPSAGNLQAYEVYLVCDDARKAALVQAAGDQEFLLQAPVVLVFCAHAALAEAKYEQRGAQLYCIQDATIACTFAMLSATALGLSCVWVARTMKRRRAASLARRASTGPSRSCRSGTQRRRRASVPGAASRVLSIK